MEDNRTPAGFRKDEVAGFDLLVQKAPAHSRHFGELVYRVGQLSKLLGHLLLHRVHVDAIGAEVAQLAGKLRMGLLEGLLIFPNSRHGTKDCELVQTALERTKATTLAHPHQQV